MNFSSSSLVLLLTILCTGAVHSQDVYNIWEGQKKPYYLENDLEEYEEEAWQTMCVFNVTEPTLTVYKAQGDNSGKAVIVIPGGGYSLVAMYHEGYDIAQYLAENGITAAVLKYRLPNPESSKKPEKVPLADARQALTVLREMSDKYGITNDHVGMVGFSAGSHLTTVASLWRTRKPQEAPDFSGLIYGVTNMSEINIEWLEKDLYHRKMTRKEIKRNQLLDLVNKDTPPAFLVHAYDDDVCLVEESTLYAEKLRQHEVEVEMHLFPTGGHGFGAGRETGGTKQWLDLFVTWVKTQTK